MDSHSPLTNLLTFDLDPIQSSSRFDDSPSLAPDPPSDQCYQQRISDLEHAFEAEKFKLTQSFTIKLREEERYRIALLAKIADLERSKLRLEKDIFDASGSVHSPYPEVEELIRKIEMITEENRILKSQLHPSHTSDSRLEVEQLRTQLRLLDLEMDSKRDEVTGIQQSLSTQQTENRSLREEITQLCEELSDLRRENVNFSLENQRLMSDNADLSQRIKEISIQPQEYAQLQQRLEATTRRIQSLESQIVETSENYEELRVIAALSHSDGKRGKSKERRGGTGKRGKSRDGKKALRDVSNEEGREALWLI